VDLGAFCVDPDGHHSSRLADQSDGQVKGVGMAHGIDSHVEAPAAGKYEDWRRDVLGRVRQAVRQSLVRIDGQRVLVDDDPEHRPIKGCPNTSPLVGILPCRSTQDVQAGYSGLLRIHGHRVCLDPVTGRTDGVPPIFRYLVRDPGQRLVGSDR
jgi:hypothetical protein